MNNLSIIPYEPRYQPDFKRLNLEWIETHFAVEPHDLEQLDHPDEHILINGGQIFLARGGAARPDDGPIIGCVAVVRTGPAEFELAKMAVLPAARGQGAGKRLGQQAIDYARQSGAGMIWLESNRVLVPALTMYAALGFMEVPTVPTPYARADVRMEMSLSETIIHS